MLNLIQIERDRESKSPHKFNIFSMKYITLVFCVVFLFFGLVKSVNAMDSWYNASWGYRVKITVNSTQVPSIQTGFPVYVNLANLPTEFFSHIKSDGGDIRVTNNTGTEELPREVTTINTGASTGELWFKADSISNESYFYIYYGNTGVSDYLTTDTFGSRNVWDINYKGVWHLPNGSSLSASDSTGINNGTLVNAPVAALGQIDGGADFGATNTNKNINVGNNSSQNTGGTLTISAWIKPTNINNGSRYVVYSTRNSSVAGSWHLEVGSVHGTVGVPNGGTNWGVNTLSFSGVSTWAAVGSDNSVPNDVWTYVTATVNSNNIPILYANGLPLSLQNSFAYTILDNTNNKIISSKDSSANFFPGIIDEVRLSNSTRSADWIKTEYNNQNAPTTFYTSGTEETNVPITTTTLGTGTDLSTIIISPGGSITDAGAFTLTASSDTDSVTALTVTLADSDTPYSGLSQVSITSDNGTITYFSSITSFTSNMVNFSGGTVIPVTSTPTQFKIRITPLSHASMSAVPGTNYALSPYVSAFTSTNAQAGTDTNTNTITIDNLSPTNVVSVTATGGDTQVSLTWTNPVDADFSQTIILQRASNTITDTPVEGATYTAGDTLGSSTVIYASSGTSFSKTSLTNGTPYNYKIFTKDTNGNYSQTGVVPTGSPVIPVVPSTFTFAVLGDMQNETQFYPAVLASECQWIVDNAVSNNIQAVFSMGDITNNGNSTEFQSARTNCFDKLNEAGIVNIPTIGNHDYATMNSNGSRVDALYNNYFGASYFSGDPWYVTSYNNDNSNYYSKFTVGSRRFLILNLEVFPRSEVVTWASNIININPSYEVIVVTHGYQRQDGTLFSRDDVWGPAFYGLSIDSNSGQDLWNNLIRNYSNIRAVLSGHDLGANFASFASTPVIATAGNTINQLFINFQQATNGGDGWVGLLTLDNVSDGTMRYYRTYVPSGLGYNGTTYSLTWPAISDTTLPIVTAFTLPTSIQSSLTISVSSFTATDDLGVTGYLLTELSTPPTFGDPGWNGSTPTTYTFLTEGTKTLYAWTKDAAENISTSLSTSFSIDTTGPTGTISNGSGTPTNSVTPTFNLTIADVGIGIAGASMRFSCDNVTWSIWESYATPETNFNVRTGAGCTDTDGSKTVYVEYKDSLGNIGTPYNTGAFTLDTSASFATLSGTPASITKLTSASVTVAGTNIVSYEYKLDSGSYGIETVIATPITLSGLADGSHSLSVIGKNSVGTWQAQESATTYTWTVDTTAPLTPVATPLAGTFNTTKSVILIASGSDTIRYSTIETPATCSSGTLYSELTPIEVSTTQTIYVRACDFLNNSSTTSFAYTISPVRHTSSGSSVASRYSNLISMGNLQAAEELKKEFPNQIPNQIVSTPSLVTITKILKLTKPLMKNEEVKTLQSYLNSKGYNCGLVDGLFGPKTKKAVILFQKANNLTPDGIVGPKTKAMMK